MFKNGEILNNSIKIIDFIGSGGQGEVYKVQYQDALLALKWYYPKSGTKQLKKTLANLISKGSPNDFFLWPLALVEYNNQFGYLMELRPKTYKSLLDWVSLKFDMSLTSISKACFKLTDAFHKLHAKGLSYKDISFGNLFIDPNCGDILICDNDNVTANGINVSGLLGTPKFMAPEIVMGSTIPNTETDQFSLAILLFYILLISHPFDGALEANIKCFDESSLSKLYGTNAIFIYDKLNDVNRPVPGIHNNAINLWKLYPQYIKELFNNTFTLGVKNPAKRTRESQWRNAFLKLYNSLTKCSHCGMENIYDIEVLNTRGKLEPCILCNEEYPIAPRIRINNNVVVLDDEKQLFISHIKKSDPSNLSVIAEVRELNSEFYLTNVSKDIWKYITTSETINILPQQVVNLKDNSMIDFGLVKGEIRF